MDGRPGWKLLCERAHAGKHALAVGHGDGHRAGLGQQAPANGLGALGRKAIANILKHLRRDGKRLLGVLGAQGIRVEAKVGEDEQEDAHKRARHQRENGFRPLDNGVDKIDGERKRAHRGGNAQQRNARQQR